MEEDSYEDSSEIEKKYRQYKEKKRRQDKEKKSRQDKEKKYSQDSYEDSSEIFKSHRDKEKKIRQYEEDSYEDSSEIEDPDEARRRFIQTVFECAESIQGICEQEEEAKPELYKHKKISPFIAMFKIILQLFNPERLLQHYCRFVLPFKDKVEKRDKSFFLDNDDIYPGAPAENIKFFKMLWLDVVCIECGELDNNLVRKTKFYCQGCDRSTKKRPSTHFHFDEDEQDIVIEYFETMLYYCDIWKNLTGYIVPNKMDKDVTYGPNNKNNGRNGKNK